MAYTLDDLAGLSKPFLTADDVSGILQMNPHTIRLTAKQCPERLCFPVIIAGDVNDDHYARVKIPRIPFLRAMGVETGEEARP
jgi:hypothetical protein